MWPRPSINLVATVDTGLGETSGVLAAIARAELGQRVRGEYQGAFGVLKRDTNAVADRLTEIVGQLKSTSAALKTATGEILSGANDLSERTTKQAATIEETIGGHGTAGGNGDRQCRQGGSREPAGDRACRGRPRRAGR